MRSTKTRKKKRFAGVGALATAVAVSAALAGGHAGDVSAGTMDATATPSVDSLGIEAQAHMSRSSGVLGNSRTLTGANTGEATTSKAVVNTTYTLNFTCDPTPGAEPPAACALDAETGVLTLSTLNPAKNTGSLKGNQLLISDFFLDTNTGRFTTTGYVIANGRVEGCGRGTVVFDYFGSGTLDANNVAIFDVLDMTVNPVGTNVPVTGVLRGPGPYPSDPETMIGVGRTEGQLTCDHSKKSGTRTKGSKRAKGASLFPAERVYHGRERGTANVLGCDDGAPVITCEATTEGQGTFKNLGKVQVKTKGILEIDTGSPCMLVDGVTEGVVLTASGNVTTICSGEGAGAFNGTQTIAGGTGRFKGATGSAMYTGTADPEGYDIRWRGTMIR